MTKTPISDYITGPARRGFLTVSQVASSLWARYASYKRSLPGKIRAVWDKTQAESRRMVVWLMGLRTRAKITLITWWYRYRMRAFWISCATVCLAAAILLFIRWSKLDAYLSGLEKSVISELAIGIGTAITGIIAIAFSLSLFAIQQVADRGTPATVQAYARDGLLRAIYWILAVLAMACFAAALLKAAPTYRTVTVFVGLLSLFLSFVLLNIHFRRVVKFADPRYTISRFYKAGEKQLKTLQLLRASIIPKGQRGTRK